MQRHFKGYGHDFIKSVRSRAVDSGANEYMGASDARMNTWQKSIIAGNAGRTLKERDIPTHLGPTPQSFIEYTPDPVGTSAIRAGYVPSGKRRYPVRRKDRFAALSAL